MITITVSKRAMFILAAIFATLVVLAGVGGCARLTEPFNDAPISHKYDGPAIVGSMPDGYSNWSDKCDPNGFRVWTAFHGDGDRAAIAVLPDASCKGK